MADLTDKDRWELQRLMEKDPKAAFAFYERKLAEPTVQPPVELPPPKPYLPLTLNLPFGGWPLPKEADVVMLSARDPVLRDGKSPFVIARHGETPLNGSSVNHGAFSGPGLPPEMLASYYHDRDDLSPATPSTVPERKASVSCAAASLKMLLDLISRDDGGDRSLFLMVGDGDPVPEGFVPVPIGGDGNAMTNAALSRLQKQAEPEEKPPHERDISERMRTRGQDG